MTQNVEALLNQAQQHYVDEDYSTAETICAELFLEWESDVKTDGNPDRQLVVQHRGRCLEIMTNTLRRCGKAAKALEYAEQRLALVSQAKDTLEIADAQQSIGNVYRQLSDYPRALEFLNMSLASYEALGLIAQTAMVWSNLGTVYIAVADYDRAREYYFHALSAHEELGMSADAAKVTGNIGLVYFHLSEYPRAIEYYERAIELHEQCGARADAARVRGNMGRVYFALSDHAKALECYDSALAVYETLGMSIDIANATANIGSVYANLSDNSRALEYFQKALLLYSDSGNKATIAGVQGNIGFLYHAMEDFPKALEYLSAALSLQTEIGNKASAARMNMGLGLVHHSLREYRQALEYCFLANQAYESLGMQSEASFAQGRIGAIYAEADFDGRDVAKAEEFLLLAIERAEELGALQYRYECHRLIAMMYRTERRWENCVYHFEKYHDIEKRVISEQAVKSAQFMENRRQIEEAERDRQIKLARFQEQEKILHNILPSVIAERMVTGEKTIADLFHNVSIFFSDIVGFTKLSESASPEELVRTLNAVFTKMDALVRKHGLEKIKTIGDAYMAVCGVPLSNVLHAQCVANFALDVQALMQGFVSPSGDAIHMRIGLHCGSVVAGVIGENKFAYDLWGDAVNIASRMESHGEAGRIHCSADFAQQLEVNRAATPHSDLNIVLVDREEIEIKGKGRMRTYFLENT